MIQKNPRSKRTKKPIGKLQRLLLVGSVLLIAFIGIVGMNTTPSIADLFFACLIKSDTIYTPDYSDSKWNSLRTGMTADQIQSILGEPFSKSSLLNTDAHGKSVWSYSRSPTGISNWKREVQLEVGKVVGFDGRFDVH